MAVQLSRRKGSFFYFQGRGHWGCGHCTTQTDRPPAQLECTVSSSAGNPAARHSAAKHTQCVGCNPRLPSSRARAAPADDRRIGRPIVKRPGRWRRTLGAPAPSHVPWRVGEPLTIAPGVPTRARPAGPPRMAAEHARRRRRGPTTAASAGHAGTMGGGTVATVVCIRGHRCYMKTQNSGHCIIPPGDRARASVQNISG